MKTIILSLIMTIMTFSLGFSQLSDQTFSTILTNSNVRQAPNVDAPIIGKVSKGDSVELKSVKGNFYLIKRGTLYGYVYENNIEQTSLVKSFVADFLAREKRQDEERKRNTENNKKELKSKLDPDNVKLYGEEIEERIYNHEIWIGMSPEMARKSLQATQERINTSSGTDQYVFDPPKFGYQYLYFDPKTNSLVYWQGIK